MIRTVRITNYRGETLEIELANPYSSGFAVTKIEGLGPNKASINTVDIATADGSVFNSARVDPRNIVLSMTFVGPDIEAVRRKSYQYFPLKKPITFEVITDDRRGSITGYVESNEPNIFSKNETTQISIVCPYPYFKSTSDEINKVSFYSERPLFEFPFPFEDVDGNDNEPEMEMGEVTRITSGDVNYPGDAETGAVFTIHATGTAKNIRIDKLDTKQSMTIKTSLQKGDDLIISTVSGKKSIVLIRDGKSTNLLNLLDRNADWFVLSKGDNAFAYRADEGLIYLQFDVSFDVIYEGM